MLSQSSEKDLVLAQDFYRALFNRFYDACESSTQKLLGECTFGIAPSETGMRTFFIIAPNQYLAEELVEEIDIIVNRVSRVTAGVKQTAICFFPSQTEYSDFKYSQDQFLSHGLLGQVFDNPVDEAEDLPD